MTVSGADSDHVCRALGSRSRPSLRCLDRSASEVDNGMEVECLRTILWTENPESDTGRQSVMKSMARGVVAAMLVAVVLAACSTPPPTTGVLTGQVAACTLYAFKHPTTVTVYAHNLLVATQRLQGAGRTFRFSLPGGSYLVKDATGSYPVILSKGRTRHVPEFFCF